MYRERGSLGDPSAVPSMVLRLARTLLGAEKGLLLWGRDKDGDGKLDFAAAEGFEQDPETSVIAQRFAEEVLESDQTVREQNPGEVEAGQRPESDEEIENLVAIPIYLQDAFEGVVVCANNPEGFDDYDDEVLLSVGNQAGAAVLQNARFQEELRASYLATVSVLADAIEVKDPSLGGHSEEVSRYVAAVAGRFDLAQRRREELLFGSLLHDIGKIGIN
jgi:HD-GYP domain-containing protein (c-di-GMP phosphodiesterase class II)